MTRTTGRSAATVQADQRRQQRDEQAVQDEEPRSAVLARARDQLLPRPGRDTRAVQRGADDEKSRDEHHRRIAEAGQRLRQRQDACCPEGQPCRHGDHDHRQPVPDEEHDGAGYDQAHHGDVAHGVTPGLDVP